MDEEWPLSVERFRSLFEWMCGHMGAHCPVPPFMLTAAEWVLRPGEARALSVREGFEDVLTGMTLPIVTATVRRGSPSDALERAADDVSDGHRARSAWPSRKAGDDALGHVVGDGDLASGRGAVRVRQDGIGPLTS